MSNTQENKTNWYIRASKVRVINDGKQVGVLSLKDAMSLAFEKSLDLIEIANQTDIPVCIIADYGKFKYEQQVREKQKKKKAQKISCKEVKVGSNIAIHDLEMKINQTKRFLTSGNNVVVKVTFKGRAKAHKDVGYELIKKFIDSTQDLGTASAAYSSGPDAIVATITTNRNNPT